MSFKLKSGEEVFDRPNSHFHKEVLPFLEEALGKVESGNRQFFVAEVDFVRIIGQKICVLTLSGDEIVYAQRPKRQGLTRFVKNRQAEDCSNLVVILVRSREGSSYILVTAFIGTKAEPEPWDRNATENSETFWNTHALIWDSEPVIPGTEQKLCPHCEKIVPPQSVGDCRKCQKPGCFLCLVTHTNTQPGKVGKWHVKCHS